MSGRAAWRQGGPWGQAAPAPAPAPPRVRPAGHRGRAGLGIALAALCAACAGHFRYAPAAAVTAREAQSFGSAKFAALWPAVRAVVGQPGAPGSVGRDPQARHAAARRSGAIATATLLTAVLAREQRPLATAAAVLRTDKTGAWAAACHHGGSPLTLDKLALWAMQAFYGEGIGHVAVDAFRVTAVADDSVGALESVLEKGEKFAESYYVLAHFDQASVLGDGEHVGWVAVVGGYDAVGERVLLLDPASPDLSPFWVPLKVLLAAMARPDPDTGDSRGYLVVRLV